MKARNIRLKKIIIKYYLLTRALISNISVFIIEYLAYLSLIFTVVMMNMMTRSRGLMKSH